MARRRHCASATAGLRDPGEAARSSHLDKDVAHARLAKVGVALGPHDANGLAVEDLVVQLVQGSLGCTEPAQVSLACLSEHLRVLRAYL